MGKGKQISVKSMVASKTGEPAVMFRLGEEFVNMPIADARKVGIDLISAADRAEFEAKFVRHLRGMGMEGGQVGELLALLRAADAEE